LHSDQNNPSEKVQKQLEVLITLCLPPPSLSAWAFVHKDTLNIIALARIVKDVNPA